MRTVSQRLTGIDRESHIARKNTQFLSGQRGGLGSQDLSAPSYTLLAAVCQEISQSVLVAKVVTRHREGARQSA